MNSEKKKDNSSRSGLIIIGVLVALFALPEIIGVGLQMIKWRPDSTSNKGELVQPARPIRDSELLSLANERLKFSDFKQSWTMVHFSNADCNDTCIRNVYFMRQVQTALGKEQGRIRRVLILTGEAGQSNLAEKLKDYPGTTTVIGPKENVQDLAQQFTLPGASTADPGRIYLVDPLGNLMMSYKDDPRGMLKDLTHLMKISWSG